MIQISMYGHKDTHKLCVSLVGVGRALYLILRTPLRASYLYVSLTWELGEGTADTLGKILSSAFFSCILSFFLNHFLCSDSLLQRKEGEASSV